MRSLAFIDADNAAEETLALIVERLSDIAGVKTAKTPVPHALLEKDEEVHGAVIVWASPPHYNKGTVEDLVCRLLKNRCNTLANAMRDAITGLCELDAKRVYKLTPLVILTACGGARTLVYSQSLRRCGFDPYDALRALGVTQHDAIKTVH